MEMDLPSVLYCSQFPEIDCDAMSALLALSRYVENPSPRGKSLAKRTYYVRKYLC